MDLHAAKAIREAIADLDFRQARVLWECYAADLRAMISAGTATPEAMERAGGLVRSACLAAASFRANAAGQMAQERIALSYGAVGNQG